MSRQWRVAVVGATGAVGEAMVSILAQREFPVGELIPLASERSAGDTVDYGKRSITVRNLEEFDFADADLALFSAGGSISREYAPRAADAGCVVVDNSSEFRYDPDVPLVVSEVNPDAIADFRERNIIANPNCSTMQMLVAVAPIHRAVGVTRINVATYQSVSGAGRGGMKELAEQTAALLNFKTKQPEQFPVQIAFNAIPHIDRFEENGFTREEMKMVWETHKILDPGIGVNPTAVRVPVFYGHSEAVHLETRVPLDPAEARELLADAPGVVVVDEAESGGYPTAVTHAAESDGVFVGRIRQDPSHPCGLDLWIVSDNLRKGAALNAVQIAELLVNHHL
ncbi:MAG: aspartate-semialdehyde dehydrogenase [Pseudomonadota bacterium]